jgi:hypothetical protein
MPSVEYFKWVVWDMILRLTYVHGKSRPKYSEVHIIEEIGAILAFKKRW